MNRRRTREKEKDILVSSTIYKHKHLLLKGSIRASQVSTEGSIANDRTKTNLKLSALTLPSIYESKKQRTLDHWTWTILHTGIHSFVLHGYSCGNKHHTTQILSINNPAC